MRDITVTNIILILILSVFQGYGQMTKTDSLKELLNQDFPDSTKTRILNELSVINIQHDVSASLQYAYLSYEIALRTHDIRTISISYLRIGNTYSSANIHNIAKEYYLKSMKILQHTRFSENMAKTYAFLGQAYNNLQQYDSARKYYNLAYSLFRQQKNAGWETRIQLFKGEVDMNTGNFDSALFHFQKALSWYQRKGDTLQIINSLKFMADLMERKERFRDEENILKKIKAFAAMLNNRRQQCFAESRLAACLLKNDHPGAAYPLLMHSDSCAKAYHCTDIKTENLLSLSNYHAINHHPEKAYNYFKQYLAYKDSLQNKHSDLVKKLFDIRYDTESKTAELELLKKNNDIQDLHYEKNITYKHISQGILFTILLILLILIILYLFERRSHYTLLKTNKKLEKINREMALREKEQQHENQIRNKLFLILAHDLINPFNALLGFAELLSEEIHEFDRKDIKRHSEFIYQSAKQLHFLLENLLQWARIQTGRVKYQPSYFKINKLIRDITQIYRIMADKKKVSVKINTPENMIVFADEGLISVILRNLIHNAIKYTDEGGTVEVEGKRTVAEVIISVNDDGFGISPGERDKLFNLEYHYTRKGTSGEQGTGLGLIICKELLTLHHRYLTVKSKPGKGSKFIFSLPLNKEKITINDKKANYLC